MHILENTINGRLQSCRKGQSMDYYGVLEVSGNAAEAEIKAAYRQLSKKYHPDANPGNEAAEKRFREISEAYAVLGDCDKRKTYDAECEKKRKGTEKAGRNKTGNSTGNPMEFDFSRMASDFERFFGFHPDTGKVNEQNLHPNKKKKTNPIDMTDMFEKYMGLK